MQKIPVYLTNAFTTKKNSGNPTPVCILSEPLDDKDMLLIAKELNQPVTAFVETDGKNTMPLNIFYFTTVTEISACGHATLAAAKIIDTLMRPGPLQFKTRQGQIITASMRSDKVMMLYPKYNAHGSFVSRDLAESLGLQTFNEVFYSKELETLFIEMPDAKALADIKPDFKKMIMSSDTIQEVVITSLSNDNKYDYLLRSFCPWIGIDEDPVTGSVHSVLAGFWANKLDKHDLSAYQASERGGEIWVTNNADKVELSGQVVLVMEGIFYL